MILDEIKENYKVKVNGVWYIPVIDLESLRPYIEYYELCEKDIDKYDIYKWNKRFQKLIERIRHNELTNKIKELEAE